VNADTNVADPPGLRKRTQQEMDDSERDSYWIYATEFALDYYVAGRFAIAHHFMPVSANILHHAVELLLKACLSRRDTLREIGGYRKIYGHKLDRLWQEFKHRQSSPVASEFDSIIEALDHFEDIRYPERLIREGASISIGIHEVDSPVVTADPPRRVPSYELQLPKIDRLMALIFKAVGANPEAFLPRIVSDEHAMNRYKSIRASLLGMAPVT
jgi:hypothetical protein